MAARVPLCKALTAGSKSASILVRVSDPPFVFHAPQNNTSGTAWTGTLTIEESMDTMPDPQGVNVNSGVTDTAARWETLLTFTPTGGPQDWRNPLRRIRVNGTGVTGGAPDVYLLESVRGLKMNKYSRRTGG